MIKSINDLEAIKTKMAPLLALRTAKPRYKLIFHYNSDIRPLGVDELIAYAISKIQSERQLDVVVYREYDEHSTESIHLSVIEETRTTRYQHLTKEVINIIFDKHLTRGLILNDHVVETSKEDLA